jgi:CBS domain-containing protein
VPANPEHFLLNTGRSPMICLNPEINLNCNFRFTKTGYCPGFFNHRHLKNKYMNFKPNFVRKKELQDKNHKGAGYEPVTKYMATELFTFTPDTEIIEVIEVMLSEKISGAPVLDDQSKLVGLISEKDCLKLMIESVYHNHPVSKGKVRQYMTTDLKTVSMDADVVDVANEFLKTRFKRFPVVDDEGRLVGQVSRRDILRAIKTMNSTTWKKEFSG